MNAQLAVGAEGAWRVGPTGPSHGLNADATAKPWLAAAGALMLGLVRDPGVAGREPLQPYARLIRLATGGLLAYSVALPLIRLYTIATGLMAPDPGLVYAIVALGCYLPLQTWLVARVSHAPLGWRQSWPLAAVAAVAAVIFGVLPAVGVGWVGMLYVPAALALVGLPAPWSLAAWATLVASNTPLTLALGHPEWATYFTIGMVFQSVSLAVGLWLLRGALQLQAARLAVAEQAVLRERERINRDLMDTLGIGLEAIAACGGRASELAAHDPSATAEQLQTLVNSARDTLAEARRTVQRYRESSLRAELGTAAALMAAAGIDADFDVPSADLSFDVEEAERANLHHRLTQALNGGARVPIPRVVALTSVGPPPKVLGSPDASAEQG